MIYLYFYLKLQGNHQNYEVICKNKCLHHKYQLLKAVDKDLPNCPLKKWYSYLYLIPDCMKVLPFPLIILCKNVVTQQSRNW